MIVFTSWTIQIEDNSFHESTFGLTLYIQIEDYETMCVLLF